MQPNCNEPISNFGFNFNLRRYTMVGNSGILKKGGFGRSIDAHDVVMRINQAPVAGYEKMVGRCSLTPG
jgi:hypothetical protein